MIFNKLTRHDIKKIKEALKRIEETMKIVNEDTCHKDYVIGTLNHDLDDIIFYANEMRKDIKK